MQKAIKITSVAGCIFSSDRKEVLLVKRRDVPVWVLPGGGIDVNESSKEAVIREILEETGFTVKIDRLVCLYLPMNRLTKPTHLYECTIIKGKAKTSSETKDVQFFPLTKLPLLIPPPFRGWINDAYTKQTLTSKKITDVNYTTLLIHLVKHPILVLRFILSRIGLTINS